MFCACSHVHAAATVHFLRTHYGCIHEASLTINVQINVVSSISTIGFHVFVATMDSNPAIPGLGSSNPGISCLKISYISMDLYVLISVSTLLYVCVI
jgi:hypothetical protein